MPSFSQRPADPRRGRRTPKYPRKLSAVVGFAAVALSACGGARPSFGDVPSHPYGVEPSPVPKALEDPQAGSAAADADGDPAADESEGAVGASVGESASTAAEPSGAPGGATLVE